MAMHRLKTWPSYFQAIKRGEKTFEVRRNDRDFQPNDSVILQEWDPKKGGGVYTGEWLAFKIGWVLAGHGDEFGADALSPLYCVFSLVQMEARLGPGIDPPMAADAYGATVRALS